MFKNKAHRLVLAHRAIWGGEGGGFSPVGFFNLGLFGSVGFFDPSPRGLWPSPVD